MLYAKSVVAELAHYSIIRRRTAGLIITLRSTGFQAVNETVYCLNGDKPKWRQTRTATSLS